MFSNRMRRFIFKTCNVSEIRTLEFHVQVKGCRYARFRAIVQSWSDTDVALLCHRVSIKKTITFLHIIWSQ